MVALNCIDLLVETAFFLVIILFLGLRNGNLLFPSLVLRLNTAMLPMLSLNLVGSQSTFGTSLSYSKTTLVYCDKVSAVNLSGNPVQHQRTKYIELDIHFVREKIQ